ncbi:hypothetical protein [Microcoleus sp. PH2017_27_LUM_O_A]|nr:hypothetical protein [Microcoleus sp. PH2017_27_LUM_O_A]
MLFALLDVSSIPHSLIENVTHPTAAIDRKGDRSFLLISTAIVLTNFN